MDPALRDLVATGPLCHLTTLNPDGSPQVTVVWVGAEGEDLVTAHLPHNQKVRNMERDPRVVLSFLAPDEPGALPHALRETPPRPWDKQRAQILGDPGLLSPPYGRSHKDPQWLVD